MRRKCWVLKWLFNLAETGITRSKGWKSKPDKLIRETVHVFLTGRVINYWNKLTGS